MYGSGQRDFGRYFVSPSYTQQGRSVYTYYGRGRGISDIFRGVYNFLVPLISSGSKAVGKELVKGGIDVLGGLTRGDKSLGELVRDAGKGGIRNLAKMAENKIDGLHAGSGLRIKGMANVRQSLIHGTTVAPGTTVKRRRKSSGRVVKKRTKRRTTKRKSAAKKPRRRKTAKKKPKKRSTGRKKKTGGVKRRRKSTVQDIFN